MIRTLIVDDSAFMRKVIADILDSDPDIEVIDTARDGMAAVQKVQELRPDVITMDVEMPKMDGLTALSHIMSSHPTPVVMLSNLTHKGASTTIKALEAGAVDFIAKTSGSVSIDIKKIAAEILEKVKLAANAHVKKVSTSKRRQISNISNPNLNKVIVIGASTGGPQTLLDILPRLPENVPPIFIVQHMPAGFTKSLAERLNSQCAFDVKEAKDGDHVKPGQAFLAPGGCHMIVRRSSLDGRGIIHLDTGPPVNNIKPSIDVMMHSMVEIYGKNIIGVLLTGMGNDGAKGMCSIKKCGGMTIAQNEASSVIFGMPKVAIKNGCTDKIASMESIPYEIMRVV